MHPGQVKVINEFLSKMENVNYTPDTMLHFQFQEIQFVSSVPYSIQLYYQQYAKRVCYMGNDISLLNEALSTWFNAPTQPLIELEDFIESVFTFLSLLQSSLGEVDYCLYDVELPFDFFGAFSEHFVIAQNERLYLLTLSIS